MKKLNVVAAIIFSGDRIFATQRGYGEFKDLWEFPGGKIEFGESPEEALVREIREELGADIEVLDFVLDLEWQYPSFYLYMSCYKCVLRSDYRLLEHEDGRWLGKNELDSVNWIDADVIVVDYLKDNM